RRHTRFSRDWSSDVCSSDLSNRWACVCDCGARTVVAASNLGSGQTKSCGCYNRTKNIKHGMAGTATWNIWVGMRKRCEKTSQPEIGRASCREREERCAAAVA